MQTKSDGERVLLCDPRLRDAACFRDEMPLRERIAEAEAADRKALELSPQRAVTQAFLALNLLIQDRGEGLVPVTDRFGARRSTSGCGRVLPDTTLRSGPLNTTLLTFQSRHPSARLRSICDCE
ncbi:MAG: hypothetical protein ABIS17_02540 [Casimicrobiaceae bacterium]